MRIRTIKPTIHTDSRTGQLSDRAFRLFVGLLNMADDFGVLCYDLDEIHVLLFPYVRDETSTYAIGEPLINELLPSGLVVMFVVIDDESGSPPGVVGESSFLRRTYLWITNFSRHQRVEKPSSPLLPGWKKDSTPESYGKAMRVTVQESGSPPGVVGEEYAPEVEVEVEVEGKGKEVKDLSPAEQDDGFAQLWDAYPERNGKKLDKAKTLLAWKRLSKTDRRMALVGVGHYRAACDEALTIPKDPLRWLQGKCWGDWQEPATPSQPPSPGGHHGAATANGTHRNGYDLAVIRSKLGEYLASQVVAEIEGSLAESGTVTPRRLAGAAKARGRGMRPPVDIPEIEEL